VIVELRPCLVESLTRCQGDQPTVKLVHQVQSDLLEESDMLHRRADGELHFATRGRGGLFGCDLWRWASYALEDGAVDTVFSASNARGGRSDVRDKTRLPVFGTVRAFTLG
jgi:hypothetical protein